MRFFKWFIQISCYLLYTLIVLLLMLWFQFPAAAVKARIESELHNRVPGLEWEIGKIGLSLPGAVRMDDVKISRSNSRQKTPLKIDSLSLQPDLLAYQRKGKLSAEYSLKIFGGKVSGRLSLAKDYSMEYDGNVEGIQVDAVNKSLRDLDRIVLGTLSGAFTGKGNMQGIPVIELQGDVQLQKGTISLQEPVLGMEQLVFNQMGCRLQYGAGVIHVDDGKMESRLLAAEYSGAITPAKEFMMSQLQLKGFLTPRPEFLTGINDAMAVTVFKKQLQEGKLPLTINGTLQQPGIVFGDLPADLNKRMRGGSR
jgi:type II secretion system protein N